MKRLVSACLILSLSACALKPAPITNLDVHSTVSGLSGDERQLKLNEITVMIDERCEELNRKKRNLNLGLIIPAAVTLSPLMVGGTIYLCQVKARNATRNELNTMKGKKKEVDSLRVVTTATASDSQEVGSSDE